jgi:hypothetical protein
MANRKEELFRISDAEAQRLVRFYSDAEAEILKEINRGLSRGNNVKYLQAMLQNVRAILEELRNGSRTWCEEAVPRIYTEGIRNADAQAKLAADKKAKGAVIYDAQGNVAAVAGNPTVASVEAATIGFGAIHQQAVFVLLENVYSRLDNVVQTIGWRVDDIYRHMALEAIRGSVAGYETWQQAARKFRDNLEEKGITGFTDKAGRDWNMRTYAEMVARTSTMEAHLQGTANRLLEHGYDLVKVSKHANPCEKCVSWEGKILSITGKTSGYKTLDEARNNGLFHPNCRHAYSLYLADLTGN